LFSTSNSREQSRKELRTFGLILACGFFFIGIIPVVFRHARPGTVWLSLSGASVLTGFLAPNLLRHVHRVWMILGNILGWINTRIGLSAIFYVVVTPVRLIMNIAGNDPMNRRFDLEMDTYRVPRKAREAEHMRRQF
jgi:Saxitoxin biosynthesis operon protein SxtJ